MKLHVISFDVPWPANYGGVIDVYNRLEALNDNGVELILHAFDYGRGPSKELHEICSEVHYYKRKNKAIGLLKKGPMITSTRASKKLLSRLQEDDYPILFEGQHTTAFLGHPSLVDRKKLVRIHNIEHEYYLSLNKGSSSSGKAIYFKREAAKLNRHETVLKNADKLLCITPKDTEYYQSKYGNATYLPVAIKCKENTAPKKALKPYILYHGNLSISENINAAMWLLESICPNVDHDFIFAGKDPVSELKQTISRQSNVSLIDNPSEELMDQLINNAEAHVFHTTQSTGIKIKLLNALCSAAPIFCNDIMVNGTGLNDVCIVHNDSEQYLKALKDYLNERERSDLIERKKVLEDFSYHSHAKKLTGFLQ